MPNNAHAHRPLKVDYYDAKISAAGDEQRYVTCETLMVLVLRLASITDADTIIAFDHIAASEPARVQFIHDQIKSSACYVAVIEANVVAYAVLNYKFSQRVTRN